ncbi:heme peroxidase [Hyaloraphidium curvatum]|nr:heme peroxidase [Hyaloraphidium curvatum]
MARNGDRGASPAGSTRGGGGAGGCLHPRGLAPIVGLLLVAAALVPPSAAQREWRSVDGSGNNLANRLWGAVNGNYTRVRGERGFGAVIPEYADGISAPYPEAIQFNASSNTSYFVADPDGSGSIVLPTPRFVSNSLLKWGANTSLAARNIESGDDPSNTARQLSEMVTYWGHYISNDISKGYPTGDARPIAIPRCDDMFDPFCTGTATSLAFRRFAAYNSSDATAPRMALNSISSFLDNTPVYGYNAAEAAALRANRSGLLVSTFQNMTASDGTVYEAEFLPLVGQIKGPFASYTPPRLGIGSPNNLFAMGAAMGFNGAPMTTALTMLFHREHNRLARKFVAEHPDWDDERLYQTARNWVNAFEQHITYREYLPLLHGSNLLPLYSGYKPDVDPSAHCFYSSVTLRYGHSEMTDTIQLSKSPNNPSPKQMMVRQAMFLPQSIFFTYDVGTVLLGAAEAVQRAVDPYYCETIRNYVWDIPSRGGRDIGAVDIARAREMGCWNYLNARMDLGTFNGTAEQLVARGFDGITSDPELRKRMEATYGGKIELVDALVGGLAEDHVNGGSLGPLFLASSVRQFTMLRDGDRFWYENTNVTGFTDADLDEIRNTSLRTLILRNTNLDESEVPLNIWQVSPTGASAAGDNPTLNAKYTNFVRLTNDYSVYWKISGSNLAVAQQLAGGVGWAGLGFTPTATSLMNGADFVIAHKPDEAGDYEIAHHRASPKGFDRPVEVTEGAGAVQVKGISYTSMGAVVFEWERPLDTGDPRDQVIKRGGNFMIFAYDAARPTLAFHGGNRGTFQADLYSTSSNAVVVGTTTSVQRTSRTVHGLGMIFVFGAVYPTAIYIARFARHTDYWLDFHTKAQSIGGVSFVALASAAAATVNVIGGTAHAIVGITIFSIVCFQIILGFAALLGLSTLFKGHIAFKYMHRFFGYAIIVLGWVNIHLGMNLQWPDTAWIGDIVVGVWQALFATLFFLTELGWYGLIAFPMPDEWISPLVEKGKRWFMRTFRGADASDGEELLAKEQEDEFLNVYTWDDINLRVTQGDQWLVIEDKVYDVSDWMATHPGGKPAIEKMIGMDATFEFYGGYPPMTGIQSVGTDLNTTVTRTGYELNNTGNTGNTGTRRRRTKRDEASAPAPQLGAGIMHDHSFFAHNKLRSLLVGRLASGSKSGKAAAPAEEAEADHLKQEFRRFALTHVTNVSEALHPGNGPEDERPSRRFQFVPVVVRPEDPDEFLPGEYVEVRARIKKNRIVVRQYTPISGSLKAGFEISVKIYPRGMFTSWLDRNAVPGKLTIEVRGPLGAPILCPARDDGCWDRVLLIAGGSGVTPCLQLIQHTIARAGSRAGGKVQPTLHLIYVNRTEREVLEYPYLDFLAEQHPDMLEVQYEYGTLEPSSLLLGLGYLNEPPVDGLERRIFVCGPPNFEDFVRRSLQVMSVKDDMIGSIGIRDAA